jgi:hypothetical protein
VERLELAQYRAHAAGPCHAPSRSSAGSDADAGAGAAVGALELVEDGVVEFACAMEERLVKVRGSDGSRAAATTGGVDARWTSVVVGSRAIVITMRRRIIVVIVALVVRPFIARRINEGMALTAWIWPTALISKEFITRGNIATLRTTARIIVMSTFRYMVLVVPRVTLPISVIVAPNSPCLDGPFASHAASFVRSFTPVDHRRLTLASDIVHREVRLTRCAGAA